MGYVDRQAKRNAAYICNWCHIRNTWVFSSQWCQQCRICKLKHLTVLRDPNYATFRLLVSMYMYTLNICSKHVKWSDQVNTMYKSGRKRKGRFNTRRILYVVTCDCILIDDMPFSLPLFAMILSLYIAFVWMYLPVCVCVCEWSRFRGNDENRVEHLYMFSLNTCMYLFYHSTAFVWKDYC